LIEISVNAPTPAEVEQLAGQNLQYTVDVSAIASNPWVANSAVAAGQVVRPTTANQTGFVYTNAGPAGQTGPLEPAWAKTAGLPVPDGSVNWTTTTPPAVTDDYIASATWTLVNPPDANLIISIMTNTLLVASAYLGGGTAGAIYQISVQITMHSGAKYGAIILLSIL
jgi:hypothetical protein